ncbi:hypothetical protein GCM10023085_69860 [Actinomadura viridis]|uniref:Uncharacterized protein n=1 Tax=Actinomadura viridis TaxID=58110 RepID=A0A931DIT0_9ACTN|nr:hypothetical protein [Actinomadura viridis]MBG6090157.1 hypothetical protein [Actinomadura viridis]
MPYELDAVIGPFDLLRKATGQVREAVVAPLHRRLGLLPVTRPLLEELAAPPVRDGAGRRFTLLSPGLAQLVGRWSREAPVAYVEASFFGGDGYQTAAVWRSGGMAWGPAHTWDFSGPRHEWPINAALARLGVGVDGPPPTPYHDLFAEVGLARERENDGWLSAGREAAWAAGYDEWQAARLAERERRARAAAESERHRRLPDVPVPLDGRQVMEVLGLPPGPRGGAAVRHLQDLCIERGPLTPAEGVTALRAWAAEHDER